MPSDEQALIELEERISARAAELKVYRELMRDRIYVNADGSITTSQERLCRLMAENARLTAQLAERDAEIKGLVEAGGELLSVSDELMRYIVRDKTQNLDGDAFFDNLERGLAASDRQRRADQAWRAALARSEEGRD